VPEKKKKRSLADTHPEIAQETDGWDPSSVATKSGRSLTWRCSLGHTWSGRVADRTRGHGTQCPYLRHIKQQGGKFADKIGIEPFDGYSESWLKESFSLRPLMEIMSRIDLEKDE
jgi:hypothetical protein